MLAWNNTTNTYCTDIFKPDLTDDSKRKSFEALSPVFVQYMVLQRLVFSMIDFRLRMHNSDIPVFYGVVLVYLCKHLISTVRIQKIKLFKNGKKVISKYSA